MRHNFNQTCNRHSACGELKMSTYENFEELKKDCENFVEASKKRGAYDGIKKLLTELYPDKAHFIYELLQNAEDMWASEVMFTLTSDTLIFEHNGKKRDFTLDDISAITNVGQSPKRDDPTSIGQFGVGFKAVYAYTNTPEIHSGKYDFKIIDMLMPEDNGVKKSASYGVTQFIFPLGNDTKDLKTALREIESGLRTLDENSILFLSHIKTIRYQLSNGTIGSISNNDDISHIKKIVVYTPNNTTPNISYFLKFDKKVVVNIRDKQENRCVSVAYRMVQMDYNKFMFDPSLQGKVCIYFPAEKESNNLRFHINAPFASTVARDSVRDCPENKNLISNIADLICESIDWIKENGYWDRSIYSILPHSRDVNTNFSSIVGRIQSKIQNKFITSKLIQINNSQFIFPKECVQLGRTIAKIFTNDDFKRLEGRFYILAAQPYSSTQPTTNEIHFFTDLSIGVINEIRFVKLLKDNAKQFASIISNSSLEWIVDLYSVLYDIWQNNQYDAVFLRHIPMLPATNGKLYCANDKVYLESGYEPKNIKDPIYIHHTITDNAKTYEFVLKVLAVPIMSSKEDHLEEIRTGNSDDAISGMIGILEEYSNASNKREFIEKYRDEPIFLSTHSYDKSVQRVKASDCCWSDIVAPFFKQNELVTITSNNGTKYSYVKCVKVLALSEYQKIFNSEEIKMLYDLFNDLGGNSYPQIISCDVEFNPLCKKWIETNKFRKTNVTKTDYTITGLSVLDELVDKQAIETIKTLWDIMIDVKIAQNECYLYGNYSPSTNGGYWYGESTLVYYLKRKKWLPTRNGKFVRPCEITKEDLYEGFNFIESTPLLKAIGFGDKSQQSVETISQIKTIIPEANEQQQKLIALILEQPDLAESLMQQVEKERLGLLDALNKQNRSQTERLEDDDSYGHRNGVKNPEKRQKKLQEVFERGLTAPYQRSRGLHYTYNTNTSKEEKLFVYQQYRGSCQICGEPAIKRYDGNPHFVAINIVNTSDLKDELLTDISQGWNTLCLCPNCAAKYMYCAKDLSSFLEQVKNQIVEANSEKYINITIELQNKQTEIKFSPKHFLALQAAFNTYCTEDE